MASGSSLGEFFVLRLFIGLLWLMAVAASMSVLVGIPVHNTVTGTTFSTGGLQTVLSALSVFCVFAIPAELIRLALAAYRVLGEIRDRAGQGQSPL